MSYFQVYIRAFNFVIETFATVGYGDIKSTVNSEYLFTFVLIMMGQLLFSFFTARLRKIMLSSEKTKISFVKVELFETAKIFFVQFSKIKGARTFK